MNVVSDTPGQTPTTLIPNPSDKLYRCEGEFARRLQTEIEAHFAVVAAVKLERGNLERALNDTEIGNHDLPIANGASKSIGADERIGCSVLEHARTGEARMADAGAVEKFAPLPG